MSLHWLEQTEADLPPLAQDAWLSASELTRWNALRVPKRRADWLLGRWTGKRALVRYLDLPADFSKLADLEIRAAADGAPEAFLTGARAPAAISLSHRDGHAVCAVAPAGTALGCDIELIEPRSDAFAADYFTTSEQALVAGAPQADRSFLLTLLWSAKESALKAMRAGLRLDTRSIIVIPGNEAGFWHRLEVRHESDRVFCGWWQASDGMVRTLVADPPLRPPPS